MNSKLTAVGLFAWAAGIVIQILTGVDEYPIIPLGAVILLVAALLVSLPLWRWAPIVGVSLAILILVGAFVTPSTGNRLSEPEEIGPFIGTSAQMLGLITAVVTGIVATVQNCRTLSTRRESGERFPDRRVVQASQVTARLLSEEEMRRCAKSSKRRPARRQKQGGT